MPDQIAFKEIVKINFPGRKAIAQKDKSVKKKIYPAGNIVQTS